eukprot:1686702-Heterocapsa_arctica.AAC.1
MIKRFAALVRVCGAKKRVQDQDLSKFIHVHQAMLHIILSYAVVARTLRADDDFQRRIRF